MTAGSGYGREDAILSGVESRTSSPVRMVRDEALESNIQGLYPCGEDVLLSPPDIRQDHIGCDGWHPCGTDVIIL